MIVIFTYNRPKELRKTLNELEGKDDILIIDDGSPYDKDKFKEYNYKRFQHEGKKGFWKQWQRAFEICRKTDHERFFFLPDDFEGYDWDRMNAVFREPLFACNALDVGWKRSWTPIEKSPSKYDDLWRCGWIDQGTIINRNTLDALNWMMYPPKKRHFRRNGSSGVGKQLSIRLYNKRIPMFLPHESFARLQKCESQMNP